MSAETIEKLKNKKVVGFSEIAQANRLKQRYEDKETTIKHFDNISIQKTTNIEISDDKTVRVKTVGDIVQVSHTERVVTELPFERIDDETYRIKSTGEIKKYNKSKTRDEQKKSIRRTFKDLRDYLNHNFNGASNEYFITLTYRENMQDTKQLLKDLETFFRALKRKKFKFDYINAVEPQARGAWHCHIMFKFYDLPNDYLNFDEVRKCRKKGYCLIKQLDDVDNVGAYLSAYLCDVEVDDQTVLDNVEDGLNVEKAINYVEVTDENGNKQTKKFIKGGRLRYYPTGMKLFRKSSGIKKPTIEEMTKREFRESYSDDYDLIYSSKIDVIQGGKLINSIERERFKQKKSLTQSAN